MKKIKLKAMAILIPLILLGICINVNAVENDKAVITFIDDDNKNTFLNIQKPIFDKYGIKTTLAIITNTVGNDDALTINELHQLQDEDFEIVSHTLNHSSDVFKYTNDLSKVSDEQILKEYKESHDWLINNGFKGFETVVYPWGNFGSETERYINLASQYYKYGVNSVAYDKSINSMYLNRLFLNKNNSINDYKQALDKTIQNNGWLIIGTHSLDTEISSEVLEEFIQYAKGKNVDILPFSEARSLEFNYIYQENRKMLTKKNVFIGLIGALFCGGILYFIYKRRIKIQTNVITQ